MSLIGGMDNNGHLWTLRAGYQKSMDCPLTESPCGDWCVKCSEPVSCVNSRTNRVDWLIYICDGQHVRFHEFTDHRPRRPGADQP